MKSLQSSWRSPPLITRTRQLRSCGFPTPKDSFPTYWPLLATI
ncbi:unnamed protein product [Medioppia subpectinata]|uniref:Uncharacterized protein n=1 Tax=Medioppia subpectinata TaxID=1979941 RepID=A0A7R9LXU4_9ACAR|nr:unnamed protein product [Medioppia subpectinata]CAG2122600.1 unnamed protein product [Medioppia subpectinata]